MEACGEAEKNSIKGVEEHKAEDKDGPEEQQVAPVVEEIHGQDELDVVDIIPVHVVLDVVNIIPVQVEHDVVDVVPGPQVRLQSSSGGSRQIPGRVLGST